MRKAKFIQRSHLKRLQIPQERLCPHLHWHGHWQFELQDWQPLFEPQVLTDLPVFEQFEQEEQQF